MATEYSYEITERAHELGGGYQVRFLEDGIEAGCGIYPYGEFLDEVEDGDLLAAYRMAHDAAVTEGAAWVSDHIQIPLPDDQDDDAPR